MRNSTMCNMDLEVVHSTECINVPLERSINMAMVMFVASRGN